MKATTLTSIVLFILVASLVTPQQSFAGRSSFDIGDIMDVVEDGSDIIIDHKRQEQRERDAEARREERARRQAQREEEAQRRAELRQQQQDERLLQTHSRIRIDEDSRATRANNDRARAAQTWAEVNPDAAARQADAETLRLKNQVEAEAAANEARVRALEAKNAELRLQIEEARLQAELRELEKANPTEVETIQISNEARVEATSVQIQIPTKEDRDPELERLQEDARRILEKEPAVDSSAAK